MKTFTLIALGALPGLMLASAPAMAQSATRSVPIADLDLSRSADRAVLEQRIDQAAARVCRPTTRMTIQELNTATRCAKTAKQDAMKRAGIEHSEEQMAAR